MRKITAEEFQKIAPGTKQTKPSVRVLFELEVGEAVVFNRAEIERDYKTYESYVGAVNSAVYTPRGSLRGKKMSVRRTLDGGMAVLRIK